MNKTYKTIWNYSLGEWVAASELAKGHGKSSSNLGKAALALAVTVSGMTGAYAATTITGGTQSSPLIGQQSATDTDVEIQGYFESSGVNPTIAVTSTGSTEVTAENVNVSSSGISNTQISSSFSISGDTGAHLEFKGDNTITLNSFGDTGVIVSTSAGSGDAKITVEGTFTLNNNANWRQFENDGLEANAGSGGSAIITHTGTGTISVAGGHAIQARAGAAGKDVEVTMNSSAGKDGIHLITTGNSDVSSPGSGSAIGAKGSSANGKVTVDTNAKITTTGSGAHGIYATSAGKAADGQTIYIDNSGTISTSGTGAHGIYSTTTAATASGTTTIKNSGNITTTNTSASAIRHDITYNGQGVEITNTGDLTTSGASANAVTVYATDANVTDSGKITVNLDGGSIKTTGESAHGVYIQTKAQQGDIEVNLTDTDISLDGYNSDGIGIFQTNTTQQTDTDITVTTSGGSITTLGNPTGNGGTNYGIVVYQNGNADGNITINNNGTDITTKLGLNNLANGSDAIYAGFRSNASATGDVKVINTGALSTQGTNSVGIRAINDGSGNVDVKHNASITTNGASSHGIYTSATTGDTVIKVGADSHITTNNYDAIGIYANSSGGGLIDIYNAGEISTLDTSSSGTARSHAISAQQATTGNSSGIKIVVEDTTLTTKNYDATGIRAFTNANSGDVGITVKNTEINVDGINADGILAQKSAAATDPSDLDLNVTVIDSEINVLKNPSLAGSGSMNFGIAAVMQGAAAGDINIINSNTDVTVGAGQSGTTNGSGAIYATYSSANATGNISIKNDGNLTSAAYGNMGVIHASNAGSGNVEVLNLGDITATNGTYAIFASSAGGDIEITNSGNITATGDNHTVMGKGIFASSGGTAPPSDGTTTGTVIVKDLNNSTITASTYGIEAKGGSVRVESNSEVNISNQIASGSRINIGIDAVAHNVDGSAYIVYDGTAGNGITMEVTPGLASSSNMAIRAGNNGASGDPLNTGSATVIASGDIAVTLKNGSAAAARIGGIESVTYGTGDATIHYKEGTINIIAEAGTTITPNATKGFSGFGLMAWSQRAGSNANAWLLTDEGTIINTQGDNLWGVYVDSSGDSTKVAAAEINSKITTNGEYSYAIRATGENDATLKVISNDELTTKGDYSHAIYADSLGAGDIYIQNNGDILVEGLHSFGIFAQTASGNIYVENTGRIDGHKGISIESQSATANNVIDNYGVIDVGRDIAIQDNSVLGSETIVNNWGTIIGQYNFGAGTHVTVNNYSHNSINLRNFTDSDGDGIRDTHGVAILDHGVGGSATLVNDATGTVRLALITNEINIDDTGEYVPVGALSINNQGIAHGHILNLDEFSNSGLIELSNNKLAGDVLVITGSSTAGVGGTGAYVTNSGSLSVDTRINQGGTASLSDILVLDSVQMGTGATMVHVNPTADGAGGLTQGDGIKIIEVLGSQDADVFALAAPVTYGAYDYLLMQGSTQRSNWFLRNNANGKIFYSPVVGAYLGNQHAASTMFNHNILDRRDNVRSPDQTVWGRINYSDLKTDLFDGSAETKIDSYLMQFGVDILKRNDWVAGAYIGYGHSDIDNKSTITNVSADGKVKGYQIGAYASWMPQENKGPYLDLWGHVARYSNDLSGATGKGSYDSTGYALSIEGGHAFELGKSDDGKAWILEPHAQLIYNYLNADDFSINNTRYHGNDSSGIQTRLGARFYMQRAGGHDGVVPFVEANWLGNYTSNKVKANNDKVSSDIGKNVGELKLGLQGKVNDRFSVWGHLGGQAGSESYRRYEAQFGLGYEW